MTSRAEIMQKMRDAAANHASGKVEWCAGWLRGQRDTLNDVEVRLAATLSNVHERATVARVLADMRTGDGLAEIAANLDAPRGEWTPDAADRELIERARPHLPGDRL